MYWYKMQRYYIHVVGNRGSYVANSDLIVHTHIEELRCVALVSGLHTVAY